MTDSFSAYLSTVSNRDRVAGLLEFGSTALCGLTVHNKELNARVAAFKGFVYQLRATNRMAGPIDAVLTRSRLAGLSKNAHPAWRVIAVLDYICDACFFPCEATALLANCGAIANPDDRAGRFGGLGVFFWFWGMLFKAMAAIRDLLALQKPEAHPARSPTESSARLYRQAAKRKIIIGLVKLGCFLFLALSFMAPGGATLLAKEEGALLPLHKLIKALTPRHLNVSDTTRGVVGLTATLLDFVNV